MINYAVLRFCPSPKKHVYMHNELLLCSWRPTMSEEGALYVRFRGCDVILSTQTLKVEARNTIAIV